jgi:putative dimethyl sulfoxide reductase chaperone
MPGISLSLMTSPAQRALIFRFLSRAFAYPNQAFISELLKSSENIEDQSKTLSTLTSSFESTALEHLQAEYTRLFINGYPNTPCPPYESVYLEKRMLGDASVRVQRAYSQWDMTVESGLIDHIATEFEFLAFLHSADSLDLPIGVDARESSSLFIKEHLCRWVPKFIEDLNNSATIKAYSLLGAYMKGIIDPFCTAIRENT